MDSHQLLLTFTETVKASSVTPQELTLQNNANLSHATEFVTLSALSAVGTANGPVVTINLTLGNANMLKYKAQLGTDVNGGNTFLSFDTTFVSDVDVNAVFERAAGNGLQASAVIPDGVPP